MEQIADSVVARGIRLEENGSGDTISVDAPESPSPTGTVVNRQPIFRIPSTPPALLAPSKVTPQRENNNNNNSGQPVNNDFSYETEWSYPDFYSF
ncbi:hypothetical protein, conserved [Angomonas deanei]|uniref:Uncharacterized protein n=1 Tax=Angomonas deanei TaxID=59799 RepID=A0A7G2CBQ0_9TRYP|nr:hypothetical protein, conserved [Angomonas deanei]